MVMVDEASQHAIEEADRKKTEGIVIMPTIVPDPPEVGGVKPAAKTGKERPRRISGIVVESTTKRARVGRSMSIRTNPDLDMVEPNKEIGNSHTTPRALKEPETDRAQPL